MKMVKDNYEMVKIYVDVKIREVMGLKFLSKKELITKCNELKAELQRKKWWQFWK